MPPYDFIHAEACVGGDICDVRSKLATIDNGDLHQTRLKVESVRRVIESISQRSAKALVRGVGIVVRSRYGSRVVTDGQRRESWNKLDHPGNGMSIEERAKRLDSQASRFVDAASQRDCNRTIAQGTELQYRIPFQRAGTLHHTPGVIKAVTGRRKPRREPFPDKGMLVSPRRSIKPQSPIANPKSRLLMRTYRPAPILAAALLVLGGPLAAQSGAFLTTLGNDTVAVERFEQSGTTIIGSLLRRSPQTVVVKYRLELDAHGNPVSYEQETTAADGSQLPNATGPLTMRFTADSVFRHVLQNGQSATLRSAAPRGTLPAIGLSWLAVELQIAAAKRLGSVNTIGFSSNQASPSRLDVRLIGNDSAEIVQQGFRTGARFDANGRVTRGDGSLTTQKFTVTRIPPPDLAKLGAAWAVAPMGAASTRDTLNATIGQTSLWIDYGRPAKRGREIWGKLVPYDTTWRFGANSAAQLRTGGDLLIGGTPVPAGNYSLWLFPSASQSYLIINSQTGQWGTQYDASRDVARIPVEKHMSLPTSEERFRVFVEGGVLMMHWDRGGFGVRISEKKE